MNMHIVIRLLTGGCIILISSLFNKPNYPYSSDFYALGYIL